MKILGISAFYHDAAAAIIEDGSIVAALQEERFTRKKHDASFPVNAIKGCLQIAGCGLNDLDAIVFYDKPFLKFERLLETYYAYAPKGLTSFLLSMPVWIKEKLFLKKNIYDGLKQIEKLDKKKVPLLFPEHHLSHAASAFFATNYKEAAIITIDGVGEWATASISKGQDNTITVLKELEFPHSLGLLYSAFTYYCGFKVNSGEYKLMGLAPYGNADSEFYKTCVEKIKTVLTDIKSDGSVFLNQQYFNYAAGLRMANDAAWKQLFGIERRKNEAAISQPYCDMALAIQHVTEEIVIKMAATAKKETGCDYLCMAGGVALNCVANGKLLETGLFKELFIQPAAGDAGGALGAALAAYYIHFNKERVISAATDLMQGSYLGDAFSDAAIETTLQQYSAVFERCHNTEQLCNQTAQLLNQAKVVGWFQGRMEFGPRALGARSILADARNPEMQKKLNLKIKYREGFRPFAPVVPAEDAATYFNLKTPSPYMLLVKPVAASLLNTLPQNYADWSLTDKLYFQRSQLPAITHIDYSARIQTVHANTNTIFWYLLQAFKQLTGCAVLVNTSFNVRGEPIVHTPEDAYRCFMRTEMDALVMGNYILLKERQPAWTETKEWKEEFVLD
jgi:carbamoyltransferase